MLSGNVAGSVFLDANGDGVRQATEAGLPGWTVQLKDATGAVINSVATNSSGNFDFGSVTNGSYVVAELSKADWTQTSGSPSYNVQVADGSSSATNTFGNFQLGTIGGEVFAYAPASPRPIGLNNWAVQLVDGTGAVVNQVATNSLGVFQFAGLGPGVYQVRQVLPQGWLQTGGKTTFSATVTSGSYSPYNVFGDFQAITISGSVYQDYLGTGAANTGTSGLPGWTVELRDSGGAVIQQTASGADGSYRFTAPAGTNYTIVEITPTGWRQTAGAAAYRITPASGTVSTGNDFGNFLGGTVSGSIFRDVNQSGSFVPGDPGLPGLTVQLLNGNGAVVQQTTTVANGDYAFTALPIGTFTVSQALSTGWMQTAGPNSYAINVTSGSISPGNSFGDVQVGLISGTVFQDANGDGVRQAGEQGVAGLAVQLLDMNDNVVQQTDSASDGSYTFTNVTPGTYAVGQVLPTGWVQTAGPGAAGIVMGNGGNSTGNDFGDFQYGKISGAVLVDDGTGVLQGTPGWTIQLTNAAGTLLQQTTSDDNGNYSFIFLAPGIYTVQPVFPTGWVQSRGATSYTITVASGINSTGNNFGDFQPPTVSGTVFQDTNKDGIQQPTELGLQGQTVQLLDSNGILLQQTVTDAKGNYGFTGLQVGTYTVRPIISLGWTQTAGASSCTIVVASGTDSTGNNFGEINPITNTIVIDSAWLAAHGSAPYVLDEANTTYTLATDVDVAGTAFVIGAPKVVLDLNGHTVTYGDSPPIEVTNGGFEQGSGSSVPGWDLSAAPTASLKPARLGMWGNSMLEFSNFSTPQSIVSDPIAIPTANHEYAATITPAGTFSTVVTLTVIDSVTGQVLGSGSSAAVNRGFGAVAQFTPTMTDPIVLEVDLTPPAGSSATVDVDYAAVFASRDYGLVASPSSWYFPKQLKTGAVTAVAGQAANFTVQNGSVVEGQGKVYGGTALDLLGLKGLTVNNVTTFVDGMDTVNLEGIYSSSVSIRNSTFNANIDNISDRMLDFAAIHLGTDAGNVLIDGNTILNYPQQGINISNNAGGTITITNNKISQRAIVTDGYGIAVSGVINLVIADNNITPVQGRGIILDSWISAVSQNIDIHGNYVSVFEAPNLEYGAAGLEATALRIRNWDGAQKNVAIHDNTFIATTGVGGVWDAIGMRVTQQNDIGQANNDDIQIDNNTFEGIVTTTNTAYSAMAVSVSGVDPGTGLDISNNNMESNQVSLNFGDNDSYAYHETDVRMVGNTLTELSTGAARAYHSVQVGSWANTSTNLHLIDTHYAGGATAAIAFLGYQPLDIETGFLLSILAQNVAGVLPGASVMIFDSTGAQLYSGTTDGAGQLSGISLVSTTYTQPGSDPTAITTTSSGPFKVVVTVGGVSVTQMVDLTSDTWLVFNF